MSPSLLGDGPTIGGSEAAAAAGLHPKRPPISLWLELTGRAEPFEGNRFTKWGKLLEPAIREDYAEQRGVRVVAVRDPRSPGASFYRDGWKRTSPDGLVYADVDEGCVEYIDSFSPSLLDSAERGFEAKNASEWTEDRWGMSGGDEVPIEYRVQNMWAMHVTRLNRWDLGALLGGNDDRTYFFSRDADLEGLLVQEVERFYRDHVLTDKPPPVDGTPEFKRYLTNLWPDIADDYLQPTDETEFVVQRLKSAIVTMARAKAEREKLEQELRILVGAYSGVESTQGRVTFRPRKGQRRTDWKAVIGAVQEKYRCRQPVIDKFIEQHTKEDPTSRPIRRPNDWTQGRDDE